MSMVHLDGGAAIKKVDSEGKTRLTIRSKELLFNVQDKIISTDRAVSIEQVDSKYTVKVWFLTKNSVRWKLKTKRG